MTNSTKLSRISFDRGVSITKFGAESYLIVILSLTSENVGFDKLLWNRSLVWFTPLLEIIPCHRVIRSDGKMGGYMGEKGIERKKRLLKSEGVKF